VIGDLDANGKTIDQARLADAPRSLGHGIGDSIQTPPLIVDNRTKGSAACLVDEQGTILWITESWRRNGAPLPSVLGLHDNYRDACATASEQHPELVQLRAAVYQLLGRTIDSFDIEYALNGANTRFIAHGQSITIEGDRCAFIWHEAVTTTPLVPPLLTESEDRYRQFIEAAPDAVFVLSGEPSDHGLILDCNTHAAKAHGYTRDELLTMRIGELDAPDDAALVQERVATLMREGTLSFKATHRRRDGSEFPVEVSARTATIEGRPCIVTFNRDASERRDYEDALREKQFKLDVAAHASRVGFWAWDLTNNSVMFSPEWKAQIGYEPHEIEDDFEEWRKRVHPEDLERVLADVKDHIEGRSPEYVTEFRFLHKDGTYRWVDVRGKATRDATGQAVRFFGCHIDVTAQKDAEAERAALTERLSQTQRLEAIGTLAGGIAHDFNNILGIITGNVELAMLDTDNASLLESLSDIRDASRRASSLVRQILAFSSNRTAERERVSLPPVVDGAVQLLRSTTPQSIHIECNIAADLPVVLADPEQLHQVLVNLGTNGWHAIEDRSGQGVVHFNVYRAPLPANVAANHNTEAGGPHTVIEVVDDGAGMNKEMRDRIFEPFYTTKPSGKGTGLGLSVVHGIVANHGGAIDVQSEEGVGTTFRIYLPTTAQDDSVDTVPKAQEPDHTAHVLLVDDEPNLLRVLTRGLNRNGVEVTAVADPQRALEILREAPDKYDAFVTDFDMPGINGIEAARQVRDIRHNLPILLCSGFMDAQATSTATDAGVTRILTKPIMAKELAGVIRELHTA